MVKISVLTDLTLTNNDNGNSIILRGVGAFQWQRTQPAISIPIINATPANNVLFRFLGQSDVVNFGFWLVNDGSDVSSGTPGSIITISQQINYLQTSIFTEDYDVDWTLQDTAVRYFPSAGITGVITDLKINQDRGEPNKAMGSFQFKRGNIGNL